jgi:rhodanese-related sulfurtransferase
MPKIKIITMETLLEMLENKEKLKVVEVLGKEEYDKGHIPRAINIPLEKLEKLAKQKLKKTDTIIVYCASYTCHASTKAAKKLLDLGYSRTLDLKGGKRWWQHAGLELEK